MIVYRGKDNFRLFAVEKSETMFSFFKDKSPLAYRFAKKIMMHW